MIITQKEINAVTAMIAKNRKPHSIIICGEKGIGKKTAAKKIAMQLLCENGLDENGEPCGTCRNCRLIKNDAHPDFITVCASPSGNYRLEDIRAVVSDAVIYPNEGRYKIYLIPDLDLSQQTLSAVQNVMLKLIEEPPESAVVILTAKSKEIFLSTIVSRTLCLQVNEMSFSGAQSALIGRGINRAAAEEAVRRCGGNIGVCIEYCENEKLRDIAEIALVAAKAIAEKNETNLLTALSQCGSDKRSFISLMSFIRRIFRDACRLKVKAPHTYAFSAETCSYLGQVYSNGRLAEFYDISGDFIERANMNCAVSSLINAFCAKCAEAMY